MCVHIYTCTCNYQQSHTYIHFHNERAELVLLRILPSFVRPFIDVWPVCACNIIMYVLQFELMIESVLIAREKWLKPVSHSYNDTAITCIFIIA